jgi:hypothetical protein
MVEVKPNLIFIPPHISHYTPTNPYTTQYEMYQMIFSNKLHLVVSSLRQDALYTPLHDKIKRQCTDYQCHGGVYMMMCWDNAPYAMLWDTECHADETRYKIRRKEGERRGNVESRAGGS